ncbi:MAG: hypothetical protein MRZ75_00520 [Roseburia sp.]|nr:hypothetical protein [Roseburia sp.]
MDATVYQIISIVGFGLAALFLVVAIILFFAFDVVALYGEVSGKTADKQVKELRENNKRASSRRREPEKSGRLEKSSKQIAKGIFEGKQTPAMEEETNVLDEGTTVLKEGTMVLNEETTVLEEGTTVLSEETTVLEEGTTVLEEEATDNSDSGEFIMLEDDVEIHTDETI